MSKEKRINIAAAIYEHIYKKLDMRKDLEN